MRSLLFLQNLKRDFLTLYGLKLQGGSYFKKHEKKGINRTEMEG